MGKPTRSNVLVSVTEYIGCGSKTQGSETSQYLKEKKSTEIPLVVASERGIAQTMEFTLWGCGTSLDKINIYSNGMGRPTIEGESPVERIC